MRTYNLNKNIVQTITNAILTDDCNQSNRIISLYNQSLKTERELIDSVLIALCGWSFKTLYKDSKKMEDIC